MARKKETKATEKAEENVTNAVPKSEVSSSPAYEIAALQKYCRKLFGVSTVTFAGATARLDSSKKYTVDEVKSIIEQWNTKEVS